MPLRRSTTAAQGASGRRKTALACERCREKKVRCDGQMPICGPCKRRSLSLDQCLYKMDNARSASSDEYITVLHNRIRELEDTCSKAGLTGSAPGPPPPPQGEQQSRHGNYSLSQCNEAEYSSPSFDPTQSAVTAMGAMSAAEDGARADLPREEFYGSSSAASFMRLARQFMTARSHLQTTFESHAGKGQGKPAMNSSGVSQLHELTKVSPRFAYEDYSLPPRPLADHLMECYWKRVYYLYPFFHRPSFERAYENLWKSNQQTKSPLPELNIGLGGAFDSGPNSIVFYCALNIIFALGSQFADIPLGEREAVAHSFFLRAKQFVGLDLLDIGTIGVVQTLLTIALYLQSTPYPNRCWHSIGVACRLSQGLGLHEARMQDAAKPLEREIQRRTWHGCVMMDMVVSMTYGRPSMTSHLAPAPLPLPLSDSEIETLRDASEEPGDYALSHMTFYVSSIELHRILDNILSDIYNTWRSRSNKEIFGSYWNAKLGGFDVIIGIDNKLSDFESNLCPSLSWSNPAAPELANTVDTQTLELQRNALHARFIHLRLLLCRPIFTQICSERAGGSRSSTAKPETLSMTPGGNALSSSVFTNCAVACVVAAIDLISLVYDTYRTPTGDVWWYNGFYTSSAGFVLIMSYTCRSTLEGLDGDKADEAWRKCEEILQQMASFSLCAKNTLQLLQATYYQILQHYSGTDHRPSRPSDLPHATTPSSTPDAVEGSRDFELPSQFGNCFTGWDEMGLAPDEFGFLGRFDVPDMSSLFPDLPP